MAENNNGGVEAEVVVVMVPLPAQGHLNQLLHLSRLLASRNLTVYFTGSATHLRQARTRVHGWEPQSACRLRFIELPIPPFESPPPDPKTKSPTQLIPAFHAALHLREPLRDFLSSLSGEARRVVVIYDTWMAHNVQDIPSIRNAESYAFNSVSAFSVFSFVWEVMQKPPLPPEAQILRDLEVPSIELAIAPEFGEFNRIQHESPKFNSGTLHNSCRAIEGDFLDLLAKNPVFGEGKQWVIGPFNPITLPENRDPKNRHYCLSWLDEQKQSSVIFVSFGSSTSLSEEQIKEIAIGLEKSLQKFIWVLREADKGDVFTGESRSLGLPEGFEDRINDRGVIVRDWAPQLEILAHDSTGGFMSHCGWNSTIESISMGVPIAAWPMHAEQPRNAALITKLLKIGVEVDNGFAGSDNVVGSERIAEAVRRLMSSEDGDEIRKNAKELSRKVKLSVMAGGDSQRDFDSFISHITRE